MSVMPIRGRRWPTGRGTRDAFARRFGDTWCDNFQTALNTGDPLADALVAVGGERGAEIRRQFASGVVHGLASLGDPDELVVELLRSTESMPAGTDGTLIATGPRSWCDVPYRLHLLSMSAGALIGVYASPSIASVLTATGRLNADTGRRLHDTARWLSSTMLPGSLAVGQAGYVATVQLRLVHAHARRTARRRGHDERRFGAAINQIDLACTWLAFTLTAMRAEAAIGFAPSEAAIGENYRYWQLLAHLLGIDTTLVGNVLDHAGAERLEDMIDAISGAPGEASVTLTAHSLQAVADALDGLSAVPNAVPRRVLETLVRRFHGGAMADALDVGRTPGLGTLMAPVTALARVHRASRRDPAERWSAAGAGRYADALAVALAERVSDQAAVPRTAPSIVGVASPPATLAVPTLPVPSSEGALREAV